MLTDTKSVLFVGLLAFCVCLLSFTPISQRSVAAEDVPATAAAGADPLVEIANRAKADLRLTTERQVAKAREGSRTELKRLARFLKTGGKNGTGWRRFLKWADLRRQLDSRQPDLGLLEQVFARLSSEQPGLELPQFLGLRRSLRKYIDTAAVRANAQAKANIEGQLDALVAELSALGKDPNAESARLIGQRLGYLHRVGQASSLVHAVRARYCQPNLHLGVSREMLATGFERTVDNTTEIREFILGTDIRGPARTRGNVHLELLASADRALIQTVMVGESLSDNIGVNGPVQIFSKGVTQLRATKQIEISASGLTTRPAHSTATVKTTITDIQPLRCGIGSRLIQRMAWRQAGKKQSQAEWIAAGRAEARLNKRVDQQANRLIAKANDKFLSNFRNPLLRLDQFPQSLNLSTTPDALHVRMMQANIHQLGATTAPPELTPGHMLSVCVHQSLISNFANAALAGRTLTEEALQTKLKDLLGQVPEELRSKPDVDPWSITFAVSDPVTIRFADGGYHLTIRGQRYTSGERSFKAMNISVRYKLEKSGGGMKAVRQGDVDISPPGFIAGETRLSASQIALRTLLEKRFNNVFKAEVVTDGLLLKGNWARLGKLSLMQLGCEAGWLTLAWKK